MWLISSQPRIKESPITFTEFIYRMKQVLYLTEFPLSIGESMNGHSSVTQGTTVESSDVLVRHPAPFQTESLPAYLLRLTDLNGYRSPADLYRLAGMKRDETSISNLNTSKLASIASQPTQVLRRISLRPPTSHPHSLNLLEHLVSKTDLTLTAATVCKACVDETGFVEGHWHIGLMVACPVHERAAIWFCGRCKKRVTWNRRGLLTCRCGAALHEEPRTIFSDAELWLLDQIRCKVIGGQARDRPGANMPKSQFGELGLQDTLSIVRFLGRHRMTSNRSRETELGRPLLQAAATVLTEWPANFLKLLGDINPGAGVPQGTTHDFGLNNIYSSVTEAITNRFLKRT